MSTHYFGQIERKREKTEQNGVKCVVIPMELIRITCALRGNTCNYRGEKLKKWNGDIFEKFWIKQLVFHSGSMCTYEEHPVFRSKSGVCQKRSAAQLSSFYKAVSQHRRNRITRTEAAGPNPSEQPQPLSWNNLVNEKEKRNTRGNIFL